MAAKSKSKPVSNEQLHDDYMASMDSYITPTRTLKKEACVICFDENIDSDLIFSVDKCGHRFCFDCVTHHIEVRLLDGKIPNCLQHRCETKLFINSCDKLLTLKLSLMWKRIIKEYITPITDRVYCPYQSCSYLMSKNELLSYVESRGLSRCFQCNGSFCLYCEAPWHSTLSCSEYKKLHPDIHNVDDDAKLLSLANLEGWRQCGKCLHIVELSYGCNHMVCRCGYEFCYTCGKKWNEWSHNMNCMTYRLGNQVPMAFTIVIGFVLCVILYSIFFCSFSNHSCT